MRGLSSEKARKRLQEYGPNALPEKPGEPLVLKFLRQFQSPLIYILLFALVVDLGLWLAEGAEGVPLESLAILAILLLNATLGALQEKRSEEALRRLKALAEPVAWVLRDGEFKRIPAREIVPGDVVRLEAGDRVPADGRLLEAHGALVDESVLTGESVPVEKGAGEDVYAGTLLVRGRAVMEVARTGLGSAMGRIAGLLLEMEEEKTPLERRLTAFGHRVARWVLLLALALVLLGFLAEGPSFKVVLFAVALAVAAVPEGLPAVLTLTLALGVERMARRKAVVRRLSAVEALGSVTLIATDKTGTLTENRMEVQELIARDREKALLALVLCNDADLATGAGDPLELGLLRYAAQHLDVERARRENPRLSERPFDSAWKFMRVTTPKGSFLKGAPEALIPRLALSEEEKARLLEEAEAHAARGFRVLALAYGEGEREEGLSFLGLVLLLDPPRPEVPEAVARILKAGVRVVMVTGDHPATALAIARMVGIPAEVVATGEEIGELSDEELLEVDVFARVRPEDKLRIVEAFQKVGEVVAMTGDGVNDAPALKRADVGVAMGKRGSDVSREVADLVLLDDNFATIVAAIEEGRVVYSNIRRFVKYILGSNIGEVLTVAAAPILGLEDVPLTPLQILWMNLVTDGLPALALAMEPAEPGVMQRPPFNPKESIFAQGLGAYMVRIGVVFAISTILMMAIVEAYIPHWRTMVFTTLCIAQMGHALAARSNDKLTLEMNPFSNPYLLGAVLATLLLQLALLYVPFLRNFFGTEELTLPELLICLGFSTVVMVWVDLEKLYRRWRQGSRPTP